MGPVEWNHSSIGSFVMRPRQPTDDRIAVSMVPSCVYDTCVAKVYRTQRRQREGIPSDRCSMAYTVLGPVMRVCDGEQAEGLRMR